MQLLLAHLQPQRPPQPQHTILPALPQTSSAPPSHTQPPIPQGPVPTPMVIQGTPQTPQGIHNPSGAMSAPPLVMNILGRSLTSYFPDVKPALLLVITKHEMDPGQIFKVDPQFKDRPKDTHLQLSDMGIIIKAERDAVLYHSGSGRI